MKKTSYILVATALFLGAGLGSYAQSVEDALMVSENTYFGTARTIGMANAFTALGGDIGSIGINPAGSAVNGFSSFTVTPGLSIVTSNSTFNPNPSLAGAEVTSGKDRMTRVNLPNIGFVFNTKTGNRSGLKGMSFGFAINASNYFYDYFNAGGTNYDTSYLGSIASWAEYDGVTDQILRGTNFDAARWNQILGYKTGMISTYNDYNDRFIGATETIDGNGDIVICGPLKQRYGVQTSGRKYDIVLNAGFNFSDKFFLGANLGLVTLNYRKNTVFNESAVNPADFAFSMDGANVQFKDARYRTELLSEGSGVYAKAGFLWTPTSFLRIGGAVQTPTATTFKEDYTCSADTQFSGTSFADQSHGGVYEYRLVSPWRFNVGAAAVIPGIAVLSVDYERVDYSRMRYQAPDFDYRETNGEIARYTGASNMFRFGAEVKPTESFALRAGYSTASCPEKDDAGAYYNAPTRVISGGFGYSSPGSFFIDFAVQGIIKPYTYMYPYSYPVAFADGTQTPEFSVRNRQINVVATLGWRF